MPEREPEHIETVIIGGGQAGLSVGHQLARRGRPFLILDTHQRVGDAWRKRWDSLRLFTPARYDALAGLPFPAPGHSFPTKDQVADYLEAYAARFQLPVQTDVRVDRLGRDDGRFVVTAGDRSWEADNAVVAMSTFQLPRIPPFATDLRPEIVQLHSAGYRNPSQLQDGGVLVVGAGNSGAEIALEVAGRHRIWLAGKESGHVPFRIEGAAARYVFQPLLFRVIGHRVLTVDTPIGRKLRPRLMSHAAPLVRARPKDLAAAGVFRVPRVVGVRDGQPLLADQRVLEVANVIWCTGFSPDFSWIDLPVCGEHSEPMHHRGIVASQPGLYFVGLYFLYAMSSGFLPGVDRDAEHIVQAILAGARRTSSGPGPDGRQRHPPPDACRVSPRTDVPAWRWGNIPIPQAHLVGLGTGMLLQVLRPWSLPWSGWIGQGCGWPLIVAGLWLGAWAVQEAAGVELERPNQVVDSGPYAFSRNPMYLAWTVGYVGVALVAGTAWPLMLLPVVLAVTQVVVMREERSLERRFGDAYRSYKTSVRRYL